MYYPFSNNEFNKNAKMNTNKQAWFEQGTLK